MSPGVDDLEWATFADFTGGLWVRGDDRECPANGLLELTDAYPLPDGGLRAAQRFTALSGSTGASTERLLGPWWLQNPQGLYCLVFDATAQTISLKKAATLTPPFTSAVFNQLHQWTTKPAIDGTVQFASYRTDAVGYRGYFNLPTTDSTGGIWRTDGSTATFVFVATRPQGCVSYQSRLFTMVDDQGTNDKIIFTDVASASAPSTANFLRPGGELFGGLVYLAGIQPSDLLTLKYGEGLFLMQGEVTNPLTRELTFAQNASFQFPAVSDVGLIYVVPDDSVYVWTGSELQDLAPNFIGTPMLLSTVLGGSDNGRTNKGQMAQVGNFLYAGKNYVMDLRTHAWFQLSSLSSVGEAHSFTTAFATDGNPWIVAGVQPTSGLMSTTIGNIFECAVNENEMARALSYTFTLPLMANPWFSTILKQLEFHIQSFTPSGSITCEFTVPSEEPSASPTVTAVMGRIDFSGQRVHNIRIDLGGVPLSPRLPNGLNADWVKLRVTITGDNVGEAPMLKDLAVGWQPGTRRKGL